ncbi:MAG: type VI secretion system baseplate subunit TssK [Gammaproteobacteria bacterium]
MSWHNKVIWSEGMFMRPHHFQQQSRYLEHFVEERCGPLAAYPWGFKELRLDQQMLALGKIGIGSACGVFPDGTPFNIPEGDDSPVPLDVPATARDVEVCLCLPMRRSGSSETDPSDDPNQLARYRLAEYEARDSNAGADVLASLQIGRLRTRVLLQSEPHQEYAHLSVGRIVECRSDQTVMLDEQFMIPALNCQAVPPLMAFIRELQGLLHHRGEALAGRVSASGRSGVAEIADFLLLQVVNRYEPLVTHLAATAAVHPEGFYRLAVEIAGELATFTKPGKRPEAFPTYDHHRLQATFAPVMRDLRQSLSMVLEANAIALPLEERKFGVHVSPIADRQLLAHATYVLAVHASVSTEEVRRRFPTQVKIGPTEQIRQLVNVQLPGIRIRPLPVAPRQIPYNAGYVYFELDRASEYWKQLATSGGFAIHIGGEFPGLQMEFWAIRG